METGGKQNQERTLEQQSRIIEASIVIPTFNERENILQLIDKIEYVFSGRNIEVIVVDDNSPDGTAEEVAQYSQQRPWLRLVKRRSEPSLSGSVMDGFKTARGEVLCVMDADLSHDAALLPKMIQRVRDGVEVVIGSRRVPGGGAKQWPWFRRVLSSLGNSLARFLLRVPVKDTMSGYFAMDRLFYEEVRDLIQPRGYKILLEFCARGRPRSIEELPYVFQNRKQGYSKLSGGVTAAYLVMLLNLSLYIWFGKRRRRKLIH